MVIKIEDVAKATEKGLSIEEYIFLLIKEDGCEYLFNKYPEIAFTGNLILNGYLTSNGITAKGKAILKEINGEKFNKKENSQLNTAFIFTQLQHKLLELTGNKQKTDKIQGKSYSFLPNSIDFQERLIKVCKKYKITEEERILKVLISYICQCHKQNNWFPTMGYYLLKEGKSRFYTDYDNFEDKQEEIEIKKGDIFNI